MTQQKEVLRLYRSILQLHRQKLPPHMRVLGDRYVRDEFKRHKNAADHFVPMFLQEWQQYEQMMAQKKDKFGQELSAQDKKLMDDQQRDNLQSLHDAANAVGESIK